MTCFDTNDATIEMNDKTEIEQYIDKWKKSLPLSMRQDLNKNFDMTAMPFEFLLGHRILINKFISTIKRKKIDQPHKTNKIQALPERIVNCTIQQMLATYLRVHLKPELKTHLATVK